MAESVWLWSPTAATNASADGNINWAEGQAPGTVNNSARSMMAAIAKMRDDLGGKTSLAGGTTNYTFTSSQGLATLADGVRISAVANVTCVASATLNVDTRGAKSIRVIDTSGECATVAGDIVANGHYVFQYDASANAAAGGWVLLNPERPLRLVTIASGSLPAAAVQDITNIPAYYQYLQLVILGASSATATRKPLVQISTDNGSTFKTTSYTGFVTGGTTSARLDGDFMRPGADQAAAATCNLVGTIFDYQGGAYPHCFFSGDQIDTSNFYHGSCAYIGGTSAVNALRLLWNGSGNFDAGTYALYGALR